MARRVRGSGTQVNDVQHTYTREVIEEMASECLINVLSTAAVKSCVPEARVLHTAITQLSI